MPGFLIQQGATVMCVHGGQAMPLVPNPSVTVEGMPTCLLPDPWVIAGCAGYPPVVPVVRHGAVGGGHHARHIVRNAIAGAVGPGNLRSGRNAAASPCDANARNGDLRPK